MAKFSWSNTEVGIYNEKSFIKKYARVHNRLSFKKKCKKICNRQRKKSFKKKKAEKHY